jgi:proline iminopeptidase
MFMGSNIVIAESAYTPKYTLEEIRFPKIEANREGYLRVSDVHEIWFAEYGNSQGIPVIFLHGGPGAGTSSDDARFFNPKQYRIILFDQRGSKRRAKA